MLQLIYLERPDQPCLPHSVTVTTGCDHLLETALQKQTALSMIYYSSLNPHDLLLPLQPPPKTRSPQFVQSPFSPKKEIQHIHLHTNPRLCPLHSTAPISQHPTILPCSPMPHSCGHPVESPESPSLGFGAQLNCLLICNLEPVSSALQPLCPPLQSGNNKSLTQFFY